LDQISFPGWSYELKNVADHGQEQTVSLSGAERAMSDASRPMDAIAALLR
jgi:hypothetical protein